MYYLGLDLGQAADYTALVIVEKVMNKRSELLEYQVRHAERFPLNTDYPEIVDKLYERINAINMGSDYMVLPDATGVGRPVV